MITRGGDARVLFVSDSIEDHMHRELIVNACKRAGLTEGEYAFMSIHPAYQPGGAKRIGELSDKHENDDVRAYIGQSNAHVLVPLGEYALTYLTGLKGILKHHCTIVKARADFGARKCVPLIHPQQVMKDFILSAYISFGVQRIKQESLTPKLDLPERFFYLNEDVSLMLDQAMQADTLAIDCETSSGDVTVLGLAFSEKQAIAIDMRKATPMLWARVKAVLEGPAKKILHNFAYDVTCLHHKGIHVNHVYFDTMIAMKMLHPEFEKSLENVARIYTRFPYWKDEGHTWHAHGNHRAHLTYNCKDTTATYQAYLNQAQALKVRKMDQAFHRLMRTSDDVREMSTKGIAIDADVFMRLKDQSDAQVRECESRIRLITLERFGEEINARSPSQIKRTLKELDIEVPKDKGKETVGQKALQKLIKKHPKEDILPALVRLSKARKLSDSLDRLRPNRGRLHYIVDACYNEFGEWSGYNDIWDRGIYPANVSRKLRSIFQPDSGHCFVQISIPQGELNYLAYDAPEPRLITQLATDDNLPAKLFASEVLGRDQDLLSQSVVRIANKTLMRIAYGIGPRQLMEVYRSEHDQIISLAQARSMIAKVFELWPGLRRRQHAIQSTIRHTKTLTTAFGRTRIFYDRIGDGLFRQAYQYAPRACVGDMLTDVMLAISGCWTPLVHANSYLFGQTTDAYGLAQRVQQLCAHIELTAGTFSPTILIEQGKQWTSLERM